MRYWGSLLHCHNSPKLFDSSLQFSSSASDMLHTSTISFGGAQGDIIIVIYRKKQRLMKFVGDHQCFRRWDVIDSSYSI